MHDDAPALDGQARHEAARRILVTYLEAPERFDLDAAVACFAEDVEYSHAPFRHQPGTVIANERGEARYTTTSATSFSSIRRP